MKFENVYVPSEKLVVSGFRVFGHGNGRMPEVPVSVNAKRDVKDDRNATINWNEVEGAVGYNILWGVAPDKLYQTYQVWADQPTEKEIRALNKGVDYYFSVEAFNENGVSQPCTVIEVLSIEVGKTNYHVNRSLFEK
ncbi:MAG: fibronectin type III domain-containing protein [Marinilabiliaceae bacterium]|nr:fibronectin type III domain-containing protein [Marinilabiliaceae bacterium]